MHQDSHKIFEAYILAKNVEQQQLNEGIFDGVRKFAQERGLKKEQDQRLKAYRDLWKRYYFPRFKNPKDVTTDKEKAVSVFTKFLNERDWGDREKNVQDAIDFFQKNHSDMNFDNLQDDALRVLLYGPESVQSVVPGKKEETATTPEVKDSEKVVASTADKPATGMSISDYKKNKEEVDKSYARSGTVAPTPEPVTSEPAPTTTPESDEDPYKLKAEITRLKKLNQSWAKAIKKKYNITARKPSDLLARKGAFKKSVVGKK